MFRWRHENEIYTPLAGRFSSANNRPIAPPCWWGKDWEIWGNIIFFLNDEEYENAMKTANKAKELYDKHIEAAKTVSEIPLSHIYYDILKLG